MPMMKVFGAVLGVDIQWTGERQTVQNLKLRMKNQGINRNSENLNVKILFAFLICQWAQK